MTNEQAYKHIVDVMFKYEEKESLSLEDRKLNTKALNHIKEALKKEKIEKPKFIAYADGRIETIKHFVHVTINDPKYGEVDGWLDKARQVLFTDAVTTDFAKRVYGWTWEETENG